MSILDYFIVSESVVQHFESFKVGDFHDSYHLPLIMVLDLPWSNPRIKDLYKEVLVQDKSVKVARWNPRTGNRITNLLASDQLDEILQKISMVDNPEGCIKGYEELTLAIYKTIEEANKYTTRANKWFSAPWFDPECRVAKRELRNSYSRYRNNLEGTQYCVLKQQRARYKLLL